ncbi:hypothetical protein PF003_g37641 [Phytophthora fragariae]|uniref:Uncharacterized protein n=1 Tax=Phytophthora fragariae TaxID=53985 RepID=A0A6A3FD84_9STRA|nr:hypothetical protein PF003_g37641 [Phytophthora fragariae]KAE8943559.1 hypothetical protein PF009_g6726 [Phytophthora fragariae]
MVVSPLPPFLPVACVFRSSRCGVHARVLQQGFFDLPSRALAFGSHESLCTGK